ncbi:MAG: hypothetical protein WCE21_01235 [Candidatus Babeliales bacterium]
MCTWINKFYMSAFIIYFGCVAQENMQLSVSVTPAAPARKMSLAVITIDQAVQRNQLLHQFAHAVGALLQQGCWQKSGFAVSYASQENKPTLSAVKKYGSQYDLALFFNMAADAMLEWRLYDVRTASMIKGGKGRMQESLEKYQAELLADELQTVLTGKQSFFATRIAFCRQVREKGRVCKELCISAPYKHKDIQDQITVLTQGFNIFAPRWNKDPYMPLVFYSQATDINVRLVSINLSRQKRVISNLTGLTMQPTFSHDNREVVYCVTEQGKLQLHRYTARTAESPAIIRPFISNEGNNFAPQLCSNGDVIFCSDELTKTPHINWYRAASGTIELITTDGYCVCPTLCEQTGLLAYCRRVAGHMQLFVYSSESKKHEQLTFDATTKDECSWSPCGTYLAFAADDGKCSRIALLNRITKEHIWLTPEGQQCTYPSWSGTYKVPLRV